MTTRSLFSPHRGESLNGLRIFFRFAQSSHLKTAAALQNKQLGPIENSKFIFNFWFCGWALKTPKLIVSSSNFQPTVVFRCRAASFSKYSKWKKMKNKLFDLWFFIFFIFFVFLPSTINLFCKKKKKRRRKSTCFMCFVSASGCNVRHPCWVMQHLVLGLIDQSWFVKTIHLRGQ